jgi:hypothetical protein
MLPIVYVLMILAPTTKTPPSWQPFAVSETEEMCKARALRDMEQWGGKPPIEWKCVAYNRR